MATKFTSAQYDFLLGVAEREQRLKQEQIDHKEDRKVALNLVAEYGTKRSTKGGGLIESLIKGFAFKVISRRTNDIQPNALKALAKLNLLEEATDRVVNPKKLLGLLESGKLTKRQYDRLVKSSRNNVLCIEKELANAEEESTSGTDA